MQQREAVARVAARGETGYNGRQHRPIYPEETDMAENFDDKVQRALAMLSAADTIKQTGGAVEIAGVKMQPCDDRGLTESDRLYHDSHLRGDVHALPCPVCGKTFDGERSE